MKLLRAIQHRVYGWEDAKKVDHSIAFNVLKLRQRLAKRGLLSADIAFGGNKMAKKEALSRIKHHLQKTESEKDVDRAKILYGAPDVNPRKLQGVVEYYAHERSKNNKKL